MDVFWKRANKWGAICGMATGLGVCMYYMYVTSPFLGSEVANKWFNMNPISAGAIGEPVGIIILVVVSLLTRKLSRQVQELVEHVHYPNLQGDINTQAT